MKKILTLALIAAASTLHINAYASRDSDRAWAAVGGFVGGVITSHVLSDACSSGGCRDHKYCEGRSYPNYNRHSRAQKIKVWVPGYWETYYDDCGRRRKVWQPGYYKWTYERRVEHPRHERPRHERARAYAYRGCPR